MVLIAQPSNDKVKIGIPLVGSIAGLVAGAARPPFTNGDGGGEETAGGVEAPMPLSGALLNWTDGEFSLSAPLPAPAWDLIAPPVPPVRPVPDAAPRGTTWKIPLLNVRF